MESKGKAFGRPAHRAKFFLCKKAQEGRQNSPADCFVVRNPRRGFPGACQRAVNSRRQCTQGESSFARYPLRCNCNHSGEGRNLAPTKCHSYYAIRRDSPCGCPRACQRAVKTRRQRVFSVFSRPGITFAEILRAGTETRPYKKQLRPMSGGPSCFYYEVKATICCAPVRTAIRSARRPVSVPQIEASRFRPLKGKHISRYLREFGVPGGTGGSPARANAQ